MSRTLTSETVGYLDRELGSRHPNRNFVEAVVRHLTSSGSGFTQGTAADAMVALVTRFADSSARWVADPVRRAHMKVNNHLDFLPDCTEYGSGRGTGLAILVQPYARCQ